MGRVLSCLLILIAALALAACGGNGNQKYINGVNSAQADFAKSMNRTAASIKTNTAASADGAVLLSEARDLRDLGDALSDMKAPKGLESQHQQYVTSIYGMGKVLKTAPTTDSATFTNNFENSIENVHSARRALNSALHGK